MNRHSHATSALFRLIALGVGLNWLTGGAILHHFSGVSCKQAIHYVVTIGDKWEGVGNWDELVATSHNLLFGKDGWTQDPRGWLYSSANVQVDWLPHVDSAHTVPPISSLVVRDSYHFSAQRQPARTKTR